METELEATVLTEVSRVIFDSVNANVESGAYGFREEPASETHPEVKQALGLSSVDEDRGIQYRKVAKTGATEKGVRAPSVFCRLYEADKEDDLVLYVELSSGHNTEVIAVDRQEFLLGSPS